MLIDYLSEIRNGGSIAFVVSGSIDPYIVQKENVRYMGKKYKQAYIKKGSGIAKSKWDFWNNSKIVIGGMTKRIEACYVEGQLALGVGVYAVFNYGGFDPHFLLAVLNSRFLTHYFLNEFRHKHLAGGYLAINKSTLEYLPFVKPSTSSEKKLSALARQRSLLTHEFYKSGENSNKWERLKIEIDKTDHNIDEIIYSIYNLTPEEIKTVESSDSNDHAP